MPSIEVTDAVAEKVRLLAKAWRTTEDHVVFRLLDEFLANGEESQAHDLSERVAVHAVYNGSRVDAQFEPQTGRVIITNGPLAGRAFRSPSGAAIGIVQSLNPTVSPNRNGWSFWVITQTGELLGSLRRR